MSKNKQMPVGASSGMIKAVIFQAGPTVSKDEAGKDIAFITTGEIFPATVKRDINAFLGQVLADYFQPVTYVVNKGTENAYSLTSLSKVAKLKDVRVSFQFNGKQVFITNKARISTCIGKGVASLHFAKLAYQLLGLIAEQTEDTELLNAIAVTFKASGKTTEDIAKLTSEAKIEVAKTGTKIVTMAISTVRREVREHSEYGVYLTGLSESRKALKAAEVKAALPVSK